MEGIEHIIDHILWTGFGKPDFSTVLGGILVVFGDTSGEIA
jgi:hypothetical protein